MLLFTSSSSFPTVILSSVTKPLPSKTLILCTPFLILRHYLQCQLSSSSSHFAKPISRTTLTCILGDSQKHVYPDPIPEFAEFETQKFKVQLLQKLSDSEDVYEFGDELDAVVHVCAQVNIVFSFFFLRTKLCGFL